MGEKANKSAKRPTASGRKGVEGKKGKAGSGKSVRDTGKDASPTNDTESPPPVAKGLHGVPGSKDDSRRCTAKKVNSGGERCKAPAIKGGSVCRVHGGASPKVKKAAKERLLELVDPALAALHKVLTDPDAEDSVKVRASLGILDRTGFGPGQTVTLQANPWDLLVADAIDLSGQGSEVAVDRTGLARPDDPRGLPSPGGGGDGFFEDAEQHATDARTEAWREYDAEDAEPYTSRVRHNEGDNVVRGEVVFKEDDGPFPPSIPPTGPSEFSG